MSKEFWESRWENKLTGWDLGQLSPPLKNYIDQLKEKDLKILIPGCGNAYEAEYLFEKGFKNVFIVEISQKAIDSFTTRYPLFPTAHIFHSDFFEHKGNYDLIFEQTFFCAIDPSLRDQYVKKMHDLLQPKGKLVGVMFNRDFAGGPPFGGDTLEYKSRFQPLFEIKTMQDCYNSISARLGSEVFVILQAI